MTIQTQAYSKGFSEALYLIESLIELNADQSDLRTALMMISEKNMSEDEMKYLHKITNEHNFKK
jgi:hypothetical protein